MMLRHLLPQLRRGFTNKSMISSGAEEVAASHGAQGLLCTRRATCCVDGVAYGTHCTLHWLA